jgi:hypothetical protein
MAELNRTIQELLVDYAGALREGSLPVFLKSLTRGEGKKMACSREFWEGTEVVRVLNSVGFADKAVTPNVSLFTSRVDAAIASRMKKAKAPSSGKHRTSSKPMTGTEKTEKSL